VLSRGIEEGCCWFVPEKERMEYGWLFMCMHAFVMDRVKMHT
jgi:hypothetical protein